MKPLIIEFPHIKQYQKDGLTCPVCGKVFPSDASLIYNHLPHHGAMDYLQDLGLLKELEPSTPPFMGSSKK